MSIKNLNKILKGLQARDHKTLTTVYAEYFPKVKGYIISRGGNAEDAKDIFQESIMVIYGLLEKGELHIQQDFGSFLIGVAKRIWLKHIRSKGIHERFVEHSKPAESEEHPANIELENELEMYLIRKYIQKLGEDCRNLLLWSSEGFTNEELAERMNYKSERTVRSKKYKCKTALLNMIKQDPHFRKG